MRPISLIQVPPESQFNAAVSSAQRCCTEIPEPLNEQTGRPFFFYVPATSIHFQAALYHCIAAVSFDNFFT